MSAVLLLTLLGTIGTGVMLYWGPYLFLNRLSWKKQNGSIRFAWEPYSSAEHPEPRWFLFAVISKEDSAVEIRTKALPLFADNIFLTLAQLELVVSHLQGARSTLPLEGHSHPIFWWVSCVMPQLSTTGRHSTYIGFFSGALVFLTSLVGIVLAIQVS